ncbi:unnamed protein product [Dovyalis caffra]|uniref:Terpene synthase N-terminal domain-containing protein n=1 Tax=Dovyalis caffra TaxID=77055 RepID=A0AAV1S2W9_9ROSI|nr:unnamed protein product [Dovyalis caffra]
MDLNSKTQVAFPKRRERDQRRRNALSSPWIQSSSSSLIRDILLKISNKALEVVKTDTEEEAPEKVSIPIEINKYVEAIRTMLWSMDDGEISISAYNTAWVGLIKDANGSGNPQFLSCLEWIASNQLPDGSWGDADVFSAYDRLLNTLACVIALKTWNLHPDKCTKGTSFLNNNISKLEDESAANMTVGFEVLFPTLIEMPRSLDIEVHDDCGILQQICAKRNEKLTRIPKNMMHDVPTTLLFSLEGLPDLDWEKLLKLQCEDGSFLFCPSSTAFAFMQTKDEGCLRYLTKTIQRFNGAGKVPFLPLHKLHQLFIHVVSKFPWFNPFSVPEMYPFDLMERIWALDRLQRLGISRYFEPEIKQYVFKHFERDGKFFCYALESTNSVSATFNLYRASQFRFPGEKILQDAEKFSSDFLREKQAANELQDKWVGYALEVPWYASLPRVEARFYIEQYGGENDVWISKALYKFPYASNNVYLELAKLDYNNCQALHCTEWEYFQKKSHPKKTGQEIVNILLETIKDLSLDALAAHGRNFSDSLCHSWEVEGDRYKGEAELLVQTMNLTSGYWISDNGLSANHLQYEHLSNLTNRVCYQLGHYRKNMAHENGSYNTLSSRITTPEIESGMQELVHLILQNSSDGMESNIKQRFLAVAKSFYYTAFCNPETINYNISKVLSEKV